MSFSRSIVHNAVGIFAKAWCPHHSWLSDQAGDAKDDLVARVVEHEGRGERFLEVVLKAAYRAQYTHRRPVRGP